MASFYSPITAKIKDQSVIIYPMLGLEEVLNRSDKNSLHNHLEALYKEHNLTGQYHIVILWKNNKDIMTDIWIFQGLESTDSGFAIDCKTFKNLEQITGNGLTASDGLIILGREAEYEESLRKSGKNLDDYLFGRRPEIPMGIV